VDTVLLQQGAVHTCAGSSAVPDPPLPPCEAPLCSISGCGALAEVQCRHYDAAVEVDEYAARLGEPQPLRPRARKSAGVPAGAGCLWVPKKRHPAIRPANICE
jgi:hypothetical protein